MCLFRALGKKEPFWDFYSVPVQLLDWAAGVPTAATSIPTQPQHLAALRRPRRMRQLTSRGLEELDAATPRTQPDARITEGKAPSGAGPQPLCSPGGRGERAVSTSCLPGREVCSKMHERTGVQLV